MKAVTIGFRNLCVSCVIGVHEWERQRPQEVYIDLELDYDASRATASDEIRDALDYTTVVDCVDTDLRGRRYSLLESAVEGVAKAVMGMSAEVMRVRVELRKPAALPEATIALARIEMEAGR